MTMTASLTATETGTDWARVAREIGNTLEPSAAERDRCGEISIGPFESLRNAGATSALVPLEFGGGDASHAEVGRLLRELGRRDPSTAVAFSMHCHLVAAQVWRHHHGMDASALFCKVVDDRAVLISTGASDWVNSSGSARRVEGRYRVSARKSPASGCEAGHVLVTNIRWDDAPDGPKVLHCAVPFGAEGVRIERTWDTLLSRRP